MEWTARVIEIGELKEIAKRDGSTMTKREIVFGNDDQYRKTLVMEVNDERVVFTKGKVYTVYFDFNATEWNGKWYNHIRIWKAVENADGICSSDLPKPVNYGKGDTPREQELLRENVDLKEREKFYQEELHKSQTAQAAGQPDNSLPF